MSDQPQQHPEPEIIPPQPQPEIKEPEEEETPEEEEDKQMPTLDVGDAFDPSFMDSVTVIRHTSQINDKGRRVDSETGFSIQAVVTAAGPDDLQRLPDVEYMNKAISVCAPSDQFADKAPLQGPTDFTAADELLWHGSSYVVMTIQDYSGYGRGFIQATAVSMSQPDPAPMPTPMGSA